MRAARIDRYGGPEVLAVVDDAPVPEPAPGQVRVEVHASSINPADVAIRNGWMQQFLPLALPIVLGSDVAGVVSAVGGDVAGLSVGDPVYGVAGVAMGGSGAFAEYAITSPSMLGAPPEGVGMAAAATLPLAGVSALQALVEDGDVRSGTRVLVHGASGGVGLTAIELARHLGAFVVATARGAGLSAVAEAGADEVVDTDSTDVGSLPAFDVTLDLVGADPGMVVHITRAGGRVVGLRGAPDADVASAKGVTAVRQGTSVTTERLERLADLIEQGATRPHVSQSATLGDIARAFALKETGGLPGKIAVTLR